MGGVGRVPVHMCGHQHSRWRLTAEWSAEQPAGQSVGWSAVCGHWIGLRRSGWQGVRWNGGRTVGRAVGSVSSRRGCSVVLCRVVGESVGMAVGCDCGCGVYDAVKVPAIGAARGAASPVT